MPPFASSRGRRGGVLAGSLLLYSNDILEHCLVVNQNNYMATAKGCWLLMQNTHATVNTTEYAGINQCLKSTLLQMSVDSGCIDHYA